MRISRKRLAMIAALSGALIGGSVAITGGIITAHAQQTPAAVTFNVQALGGGVHMLTGQGGNIGLSVGDDGVVMIDDQFAPLAPGIAAEIAKLTPAKVRFVINTHWHGDHVGGNEAFAKDGAIVLAQDNVRRRMSTDQVLKIFNAKIPPSAKIALPLVTFADGVTLHLNGQTIGIQHVKAAHTDGDAFVRFTEANVLHMGDVFFNGGFPLIDVESGGSIDGYIAAQKLALTLVDDKTRIIPGHGPLAGRKELEASLAMLQQVRAIMAKAVVANKTADAAVAAHPLKDLAAVWGKGFVNEELMTRIVYSDLSRSVKR